MMKITKQINMIHESYLKTPVKKDHCACALPSNKEVKSIVRLTKDIMFPGYFSSKEYGDKSFKSSVNSKITKLHRILSKQIKTSLLYLSDREQIKEIKQKSCVLCLNFIERIPHLREILHTDLEAHFNGDPAALNRDQIVVSYPGFYAILIYRMAHELFRLNVPVLPRMMTEFAHRETGIDINPGAEIGPYFFIDHGTGVVIGETAVIGSHVKIYQGVTLGALSTKGGQSLKGVKRHPTIQDHVTIYAGASILGGETVVGEYSTIGSNAFVTSSVEPYSRVSIKTPELLTKSKKEGKQNENSQ